MEENKELSILMERIEASSRKQVKLARLQCIFSAIAALCCLAVLVMVVFLLPQLDAMAGRAEIIISNAETVTTQLARADWEGVISNLEAVSTQIAQADLKGLTENVNALVQSSQTGVEDALNKLNAIDLDTLNKAIKDLAAVVEPLAKLSKLF